ncbi:MAG: hypothetical protein IK101_08470 [Oscillospiraceae bacterium]|nr:hypothetical protein [Oscillospiraceae bacterium]
MDYQKDRNVDVFSGREFSSKAEKFEFWMTNYFWYHFKWYVIIPLFIVTALLAWLISSLVRVDYDWEVVYAHLGEPDSAQVENVTEWAQDAVRSVTGNKKSRVRVTELSMSPGGERLIMGALDDYEYSLFFIDKETAEYYGSLGYFLEIDGERFALVEPLGLYAAVNDAEYKEHSPDENKFAGYTEAEMRDLNALLAEKHEEQVARAKEVFQSALEG